MGITDLEKNEEKYDQIWEKTEEWLIERGLKFGDVMIDEDGNKYVMQEPNLMDEGEPEDGSFKKVLLPDFESDYGELIN